MASDKQIAANRKNARLGGPKTLEGKTITRLNALRHGLTAEEVIIPGEDPELFTMMKNDIYAELNPQTVLQRVQADEIVVGAWRQRRSVIAESRYHSLSDNPQYVFYNSEIMDRYETANSRKMHKALGLLEKLQKDGADRPAPPPANVIPFIGSIPVNMGAVAVCSFVHHPANVPGQN